MLDIVGLPQCKDDVIALIVIGVILFIISVATLTEMLGYVDRSCSGDLPRAWVLKFLTFYILGSASTGAMLLCISLIIYSMNC